MTSHSKKVLVFAFLFMLGSFVVAAKPYSATLQSFQERLENTIGVYEGSGDRQEYLKELITLEKELVENAKERIAADTIVSADIRKETIASLDAYTKELANGLQRVEGASSAEEASLAADLRSQRTLFRSAIAEFEEAFLAVHAKATLFQFRQTTDSLQLQIGELAFMGADTTQAQASLDSLLQDTDSARRSVEQREMEQVEFQFNAMLSAVGQLTKTIEGLGEGIDAPPPVPVPDSTPPGRSDGRPAGVLSAGTTSVLISAITDEPAACKYAASPGISYASMPHTFSGTGGISHSASVTGLSDGGAFSYYVRCQDEAGNANGTDFLIEFRVEEAPPLPPPLPPDTPPLPPPPPPLDTAPPFRSDGTPSGTLIFGTTQATISLATDEDAACRYASSPGVAYDSMANRFPGTGGTSHSATVSGLTDGETFSYYVRCQDQAGNANSTDFLIEFRVEATPDTTPPDTTLASTSTPPNPTSSSDATFSFSSTESGSFECELDDGGFHSCTSPKSYSSLEDGSHTIQVRAIDEANNVDPTPASFAWVVDTIAPSITNFGINDVAHPGVVTTTNSSVTITWIGTDGAGSGIDHYEVWRAQGNVDGPWLLIDGNATSGISNILPSEGAWWYGIRVIDSAGNCIDEAGRHTCGGVGSDSLDPRIVRGPMKVVRGELGAGSVRWGTWEDGVKNPNVTQDSLYQYTEKPVPMVGDKLVVFLSGTGGSTAYYKRAMSWIATDGNKGFARRPVIILGYENEANTGTTCQVYAEKPACELSQECIDSVYRDRFGFHYAAANQNDTCAENWGLTEEKTVESRLVRLLNHLDATDWPNADQYLNTTKDGLLLSKIFIGGHSQGSGMAHYNAQFHSFAGAFGVAGLSNKDIYLDPKFGGDPKKTPLRRGFNHVWDNHSNPFDKEVNNTNPDTLEEKLGAGPRVAYTACDINSCDADNIVTSYDYPSQPSVDCWSPRAPRYKMYHSQTVTQACIDDISGDFDVIEKYALVFRRMVDLPSPQEPF